MEVPILHNKGIHSEKDFGFIQFLPPAFLHVSRDLAWITHISVISKFEFRKTIAI